MQGIYTVQGCHEYRYYVYIYIWIDRHIFIQPVYVYKYAAYIYGELECGRQNVYVLSCCFALRLVDLQDINLCMHVYLY